MTEGHSRGGNQEKAEITELLESAQGRHGLVVGHAGMERSGELFAGKQTKSCLLGNKQVIYSMRRWGRSSGTGGTALEAAGTASTGTCRQTWPQKCHWNPLQEE